MMTMTDHPTPDPPLREQLRQLPDAPLPDHLWARVNAARGRRFRHRRIGVAAAAVAAIATVSLPWLLPYESANAPAPAMVAGATPATRQAPPIDTTARLRALDRALQAGYERNASDAELAPLWAARARLVAGDDAAPQPADIQRI